MMESDPELEMEQRMAQEEELLIPSTACLWVMLFYLSMGTVMFAEWEQWDYLDSAYFCVTSLLKVKRVFYFLHVLFAENARKYLDLISFLTLLLFTKCLIFYPDKLLE